MPQIPADYRVLNGSERTPRAGAKRTGSENLNEILSVSVRIRRRSDAPPLPDLTRPGRRYLSRREFATLYGASQEDLTAIAGFADASGLEILESSVARRTVVLKGTVAQMNKAFAVDLGRYETADEKYRGREGPVHMPAAIAGIVEGVFGLDNRKMAQRHARTNSSETCAPGTKPLTPAQVAQLYQFPALPATGQTIAILEFPGSFSPRAVNEYFNGLGLTPPSIASVSVDEVFNGGGFGGTATETMLDIVVAGSAAPGARLAIYFAPENDQGWVDAVTTAVHDEAHGPSVISISYGWGENETTEDGFKWDLAAIKAVHTTFQEAAVLGVTIFVSSGDYGSDAKVGDKRAHVQYPASDPYVTSCGGTTIWNVEGLAFTELTWAGSGGGISDIFCPPNFPLPAWQSFARLPGSVNDGHNGRGVPDIAGNADGCSGYFLPDPPAQQGTSETAPLYAGLAAQLNGNLGEPIGYLNPFLYAGPDYVFRDISDGLTNSHGGAKGYVSGPGWDGCTGLGGVNGAALRYALQGGGTDALVPLLLSG
jgi:kumamolisin